MQTPSTTTVTRATIQIRIKDWKDRVNNLYSDLRAWTSAIPGITSQTTRRVGMYEELMRKYNIPKTQLPVLDVYKNKKLVATVTPMGLWVIAANGRVDILTSSGSYIVVDVSTIPGKPAWHVFELNKTNSKKITRQYVFELFKSL